MRVGEEVRNQLQKLLEEYEAEILLAKKRGLLTESTAKTYMLHSSNFVKWCQNDFEPGRRNKEKNT